MTILMKAEVDNLTGRNDELRRELREVRFESSKAQENLNKALSKVQICSVNKIVSFVHRNARLCDRSEY